MIQLTWMMLAVLSGQAAGDPQVVVWEHFEDGTTGTLRGGVAYIHDVVGSGGVTTLNHSSASFDGRPETCIDFGRDCQVTTDSFTVEAFVKVKRPGQYAAIAADWNEAGANRSWAFVLTPYGGLRFDVSPDGQFHVGNKIETPPRLIKPQVWYHVAAVSDGRASRIYVNGRLVAGRDRDVPGVYAGDSASLKIGNVDLYATVGPRPWNGLLDEVRISPQALAPAAFIRTREAMPEAYGGAPKQYEMPFTATDRDEAIRWQSQARSRLLELVSHQQPRHSVEEVPLDFRTGQPIAKDGYRLIPSSFQGNDGRTRFECWYTVPDGDGPFPAMLALHGHGGSREAVFDPKTPYRGFADRLARGGYVVIAPSFPHRTYCATMLWDLMRLVDILASRPEVDSSRIGVAGLSMGGEWTMWSAACDPRLKVAVVSGWMCTTEGVFSVPNCACWELPGFVELMDVCEVHLLIAPRPVLFESAAQDNCFPLKYTRLGFQRIEAGYRLFGAETKVRQDIWPAGHQWHGTVAYPFIDAVLHGHAAGK